MAVTDFPRLTLAQLGRATLARQHLLQRTTGSAAAVIGRLVGLQSQVPNPAFTGLWSRIEGFDFGELSTLMTERRATRLTLMRTTVHLVTTSDALALRPLMQEVYERHFQDARFAALAAVDLTDLEAFARELLTEEHMTAKALEAALGRRWPDAPPKMLLTYARLRLPLLQVPPRGVWGKSLQTTYALLDEFTGQAPVAMSREQAVRRYLAAAGPATVDDFERWSGLSGLLPVFDALQASGEVVAFRGPTGQLLHDLPDAPRPDPSTPAPVRILPEWDSMLMMFADRERVVDADRRRALLSVNGIYASSVLVDGRIVAAAKTTRTKAGGRIDVWPFESLAKTVRQAIEAEGEALLIAMGKGFAGGDVVFHATGSGYPEQRDRLATKTGRAEG